ncbi:MAG: peptidoglycan-binding protein [Acidimicrobiia bacterium]
MTARPTLILVCTVLFTLLSYAVAWGHNMDIWDGQTLSTQFSDEHKLCKSGYCTGGINLGVVVAVWQDILYSDGIASRCGSTGIDGSFGTNTRSFTKSWQNQQGLTDDGVVGPNTWGRADEFLYKVAGSDIYYRYDGYIADPWFFQSGGNGDLAWKNPVNLLWYYTSHGSGVPSC